MSGPPDPTVHFVPLVARGDFTDPDVSWLRFLQAVQETGLTVLGTNFFRFPGGGFTGTVLLAESHAAVHTWPEQDYAWVEIASCGEAAGPARFARGLLEHGFARALEPTP